MSKKLKVVWDGLIRCMSGDGGGVWRERASTLFASGWSHYSGPVLSVMAASLQEGKAEHSAFSS